MNVYYANPIYDVIFKLGEQEQSLKLAVKLFAQNGLDAKQIAASLGLSIERVQEYMK